MKSNKDLSDLIKANAHKLENRPSKQAWERLENRLDEHQSQNRFSRRRLLSVAAAAVGLIVFVSMIGFMFQNQQPTMSADQNIAAPGFAVEELEVPSEAAQGFYKVVEFQKTYQNRLAKPIIEGSGKKLSVANPHRNVSSKKVN